MPLYYSCRRGILAIISSTQLLLLFSTASIIDELIDRYFASVIRAEEGTISELDEHTVSIVLQEPLGVVGQIIPWNFPLLMAAWKIAPALAAGKRLYLLMMMID